MFRILLIAIVSMMMVACGSPKIPKPDPTPLVPFDQRFEFKTSWQSNQTTIGPETKSEFWGLRPILHANQIIAGTDAGKVVALNAATGAVNWTSQLEVNLVSGTGAGDGIAVLVDQAGVVHALDLDDGSKSWEYVLPELVFAPPMVYRDLAIVRTIEGNLFSMSADSGELVWDTVYDQPQFVQFGSAAPVGAGNAVIMGSPSGRVYATYISTGFDAWDVFLGSGRSGGTLRSREARPVIEGTSMLFADPSRAIVAYNLTSGNVQWQYQRPVGNSVVASQRYAYGFETSDRVFALSLNEGKEVWSQSAFLHRDIKNLLLVGRQLVLIDSQGYLHALDPNTGEVVARHRLSNPVFIDGLLSSGSNLYVYYKSGRIESLKLTSPN